MEGRGENESYCSQMGKIRKKSFQAVNMFHLFLQSSS